MQGNQKTKEKVVLRELRRLDLETRDVWNPFSVQEAEQRLLSLGLFSSVRIEPVGGRALPEDSNDANLFPRVEKDIKVVVGERPPGTIEFGPGYRTDLGVVGFAEFNYRNLGGWNRSLFLKSQVSRKLKDYQFLEQRYSATFLEPYLFDDPTRMQLNVTFHKDDQAFYDLQETSFGVALEREITRHLRITQNLYSLSLPEITNVVDTVSGSDVTELQSVKYRIATIGTLLTYDTRDDIFNSNSGIFLSSAFELSTPALGSSTDAHFLTFRQGIYKYFPLPSEAVFAAALNYSHLWGLGQSSGVPVNKRLTLGGRNSIRSIGEDELQFTEKDVIEQRSIEMKLEYRHPVLLDLGLAYFVDAGLVDTLAFRDGSPPAYSGVTYGLGVGFRWLTPVGPVGLDLAYNPSPNQALGQPDLKLQFNIGSF